MVGFGHKYDFYGVLVWVLEGARKEFFGRLTVLIYCRKAQEFSYHSASSETEGEQDFTLLHLLIDSQM